MAVKFSNNAYKMVGSASYQTMARCMSIYIVFKIKHIPYLCKGII